QTLWHSHRADTLLFGGMDIRSHRLRQAETGRKCQGMPIGISPSSGIHHLHCIDLVRDQRDYLDFLAKRVGMDDKTTISVDSIEISDHIPRQHIRVSVQPVFAQPVSQKMCPAEVILPGEKN